MNSMSCFGGGFPHRRGSGGGRSNCSNPLIKVCSNLPEEDSETESESSHNTQSSVTLSESLDSEDVSRTPAGVLSGSDEVDLASSHDSEELKGPPASRSFSPLPAQFPERGGFTPLPAQVQQHLSQHLAQDSRSLQVEESLHHPATRLSESALGGLPPAAAAADGFRYHVGSMSDRHVAFELSPTRPLPHGPASSPPVVAA